MLAVCDQVADYQRAAEWTDAAETWCEQHSDSVYPGICRVFRAELKVRRGDWDAAAAELDHAVQELTGFTPIIGAALYQTGEVELRAGRLAEAEERFRSAHEHGFTPLPGMAELRLRDGDAEAALELLQDALGQAGPGPLARAKLLPALIDSELALGRTVESQQSLTELEHVAEMSGSTAMCSAAAHRRAALALRDDRPGDAAHDLQAAIKGWTELQMPYEAAQSRLLLAQAQHAAGNDTGARLEMESARSAFERLGAAVDTEPVEALLRS